MQLRETLLLFTSGFLTNLVGVASGILLANILGPEGRGEVANYVFFPTVIAGVLGLSLHTATTIHLAGLVEGARKRVEVILLSLVFRVAIILSPIGFLILLIIDIQRFLSAVGILAFVYVFAEIIRPAMLGMDAGRGDYSRLAFFRLLTPTLYLLLLGGGALAGTLSVAQAVFAIVAASTATILIRLIRLPALESGGRRLSKVILKSSLRLHPPFLLDLLKSNIDRIFVVTLLSAEQVGMYFVAYTFASAPYATVQQAFTSQLLTHFSSGNSASHTWRQIKKALLILIVLGLVLLTILAITLPILVPLLVGPAYGSVPDVSMILALGFTLRLLVAIVGEYLRSIQATKLLVVTEFAYMLGFFISMLAFPAVDARGVGHCLVIGYAVAACISLMIISRTAMKTAINREKYEVS